MAHRRLCLCLALAIVASPAFAASARPADSARLLAEARSLVAAGDGAAAIARLAPLLAREPKNAEALLLRGAAACVEGDAAACRRDLEKALSLDPTLRQGWLDLGGVAIAERRWDDALSAFRRAEQLDPQAADNGLNLGAAQLFAGRLGEAQQQFDRYLARPAADADAFYAVASNYAISGYSALAVTRLREAIARDERSRVRARLDSAFTALLGQPAMQTLLDTDDRVLPPGALVARRSFAATYQGPSRGLLAAVLDAVQLSGRPIDPRIDVGSQWAIIFGEMRIKVSTGSDGKGMIELSAPPESFAAAEWSQRTEAFFSAVTARLALAASRP